MNKPYDLLDTNNDLPVRNQPNYLNLSLKAKRLYDASPDKCWMTKDNLARLVGCRSSDIKTLKDELEAARLIKILFHYNGKRNNPRHELVKLPKNGTPICKHIKNAVCLGDWDWLDRNAQIECYLKSGLNIVPFGEKQKKPPTGFSTYEWGRQTIDEKMNFLFKNSNLNVGLVVCAHMLVVDIDSKENEWIHHEGFQKTLTVSTPRGLHFYFRNDAVVTTSVKTIPGVDTRGPSNFVVLPPSIHPSGEPYRWENLVKPALLPIEFRREWRELDFQGSKLSSRQALPQEILQGSRNNSLWSYGRSLRRAGKTYYEIETELLEVNIQRCSPKLSNFEIVKLAAHVWEHPDRSNFV
jgi:hypothetical protein